MPNRKGRGPRGAPGLDERLFAAASADDVKMLASLLDAHPEKLLVGQKPYGHTLLHAAAQAGALAAVDLLLRRGLDPNVRERGDNTYPMHWAAARGELVVVRRLADAARLRPDRLGRLLRAQGDRGLPCLRG